MENKECLTQGTVTLTLGGSAFMEFAVPANITTRVEFEEFIEDATSVFCIKLVTIQRQNNIKSFGELLLLQRFTIDIFDKLSTSTGMEITPGIEDIHDTIKVAIDAWFKLCVREGVNPFNGEPLVTYLPNHYASVTTPKLNEIGTSIWLWS